MLLRITLSVFTVVFVVGFNGPDAFAAAPCKFEQKALKDAEKQYNRGIKQASKFARALDRAIRKLDRTIVRANNSVDRAEARLNGALVDVGIWAAQCAFLDERACRRWDRLTRKIIRMEQRLSLQRSKADRKVALAHQSALRIEDQLIFAEQELPFLDREVLAAEAELNICLGVF